MKKEARRKDNGTKRDAGATRVCGKEAFTIVPCAEQRGPAAENGNRSHSFRPLSYREGTVYGDSSCNCISEHIFGRKGQTVTLAGKRTEICIELTFHSPPPTPLLPAPTLNTGEHKVSGGELIEAQNGLPLFLAAFSMLRIGRVSVATRWGLPGPTGAYWSLLEPAGVCCGLGKYMVICF